MEEISHQQSEKTRTTIKANDKQEAFTEESEGRVAEESFCTLHQYTHFTSLWNTKLSDMTT